MAEQQVESMINTADDKVQMTEEIITRYIEVPEENVKAFTGGDVVMDLQLVSGAMIQITKSMVEDPEAKHRPVRLIGSLESVDKAEKLIKVVVNLDDAGGIVLLHKDDSDSDGYSTDYQEPNQSHNNLQYTEPTLRPFRKRSRSHKRPRVPLPSKHSAPVPPLAPVLVRPPPPPQPAHSIPERPLYNQSSEYAASQAYVMPQPPAYQQPSGYVASHAYGMSQPPYNHSSGYGASQAYVMPQPPPYQQSSGYAANQTYVMPQPPEAAYNQSTGYPANQAYIMPQPPANNQLSGYAASQAYGMPQPLPIFYQSSIYAADQAYGMPQPPPYNQSSGYAYGMPQPPAYNQSIGYGYPTGHAAS